MATDFLPVATGGGANVDSQGNFAGSSYQVDGFTNGIAQPYQANKIWRQSSIMAAAIANWISSQLSVNVPDDGNLGSLISLFTSALSLGVTAAFGDNSTKLATTAFVQAALTGAVTGGVQSDVTGSRSAGAQYHNAGSVPIYVSGYCTTSGSSTGGLNCMCGPSSASVEVYAQTATATVSGGTVGFCMMVPAGYYYQLNLAGAVNTLAKWIETTL